jgi:hypothetical protein
VSSPVHSHFWATHMLSFFKRLSERHEALKESIHNFRMPLSPMGVRIMKVVYFTTPIIGGWYIMQAAIGYSDRNTAPLLKAQREKALAKQN